MVPLGWCLISDDIPDEGRPTEALGLSPDDIPAVGRTTEVLCRTSDDIPDVGPSGGVILAVEVVDSGECSSLGSCALRES